jgi:hypothetical protein
MSANRALVVSNKQLVKEVGINATGTRDVGVPKKNWSTHTNERGKRSRGRHTNERTRGGEEGKGGGRATNKRNRTKHHLW